MRRPYLKSFLVPLSVLSLTCVLSGQTAQPAAPSNQAGEAKHESAPSGLAPKHDITGVWMLRNPPATLSYSRATFTKEEPEMTPWAIAKMKEAKPSNNNAYTLATTNDPVLTKCDPPGTPRVYFHPYPFEFVQTPKYMLMLYESDHTIRRIYTDRRPVPKDPDLSWMGYSVGHWEGDTTFVVDTVGLNDKTWIDRLGHPHSDQLHIIERFRRVNFDHMELDFIIEAPKAL